MFLAASVQFKLIMHKLPNETTFIGATFKSYMELSNAQGVGALTTATLPGTTGILSGLNSNAYQNITKRLTHPII